jgi:hypothetical protein
VSFVLNMRIFEELDCIMNVEGSSVRPLEDALKFSTLWKTAKVGEGECPFGFKGPNPHGAAAAPKKKEIPSKAAADDGARCPWPFIFFHDPATGVRDWQTWASVALIGSIAYMKFR